MADFITLRQAGPEDRDFLCRVYAGTRERELAMLNWGEAEKQAFVQMQFDAQDRFYHEEFSGAEFSVIQCEGRPVGRLYVLQATHEIRIIDIALLADDRKRGIGTYLLDQILKKADSLGLLVTIHVERLNPALCLYRRLGFRDRDSGDGVYLLLERPPGTGHGG